MKVTRVSLVAVSCSCVAAINCLCNKGLSGMRGVLWLSLTAMRPVSTTLSIYIMNTEFPIKCGLQKQNCTFIESIGTIRCWRTLGSPSCDLEWDYE